MTKDAPRTPREILGDRFTEDICGLTPDKATDAEIVEINARYEAFVKQTLAKIGDLLTAEALAFRDEFQPCNDHIGHHSGLVLGGMLHLTLCAWRDSPIDMGVHYLTLAENINRLFNDKGQGPFIYTRYPETYTGAPETRH